MVTRRYWPLASGSATWMGQLAAGLAREGIECTLITPRWGGAWPQEIAHRHARVVRLPISSHRLWRDVRYGWTLSSWLRKHAAEFDVVCVSELKHEAAAAVITSQKCGWPVVLRAENSGLTGDCHWQLNASLGRRIKQHCGLADALLAPSLTVERELIAAGFRRDRIRVAPLGTPARAQRTATARTESRAVLAEADPSLAVADGAPLAVFVGRLTEDKGLPDLLAAWSMVLEQTHRAKLWIIGDGPERQRLTDLARSLGLEGSVALPGTFDDVEDILQAADVFVYPVLEAGTAMAPLEAMASGLPIVASDIPDNREMLGGGAAGMLVLPEDPTALASAIGQVLDSPDLAADLGLAAQSRVSEAFSPEAMVQWHAELFRELAA
jgi:glycosyltransferase involved in cell wall biosynthesis